MKKKFLIVIDMQNDFITGSLANEEAAKILPKVTELIKNFDGDVVFTRDTHDENYLDTQEGKNLPIKHCIKDTYGHQIHRKLFGWRDAGVVDKTTFGSIELVDYIKKFTDYDNKLSEIHICGICTNICVITNALILKTCFPEAKIMVYKKCCAGTSLESHNAALEVMRDCHIEIVD